MNSLNVIYSKEFENDIKKIKGKDLQDKIKKIIQKIIDVPLSGKPLRYELAGLRSMRLSVFRIIYEIRRNDLILHKFEHRKDVYK